MKLYEEIQHFIFIPQVYIIIYSIEVLNVYFVKIWLE